MHIEHRIAKTLWQQKIEDFVENPIIQHAIVVLIILNAALLGLETSAEVMQAYGTELVLIDHLILGIFILEIALLIIARGTDFFKDPWSVFDFVVIAIALVPATESLSVLRALRVLRVLRLINKVESMRKVVGGLLSCLPSLASVVSLILIIFYVSAVIATNLFGQAFPELFGSMGNTAFTLFQVMTLESWSDGIARPVMEKFPYAWIFFIFFILIATFVIVNLFIAVIVDSLNSGASDKDAQVTIDQSHALQSELLAMRQELRELKALVLDQSKR
ncbi:MAG: ion transporter [Burkholderiales bacterium]|jgi:voltage-gated sodium channel|nr:ion transporter [Burkholderiales bacterium]